MSARRKLNGVLKSFLDSYTGRHTDYRGYWLFGFLVDGPAVLEIDLRGASAIRAATPAEAARIWAVDDFSDQLRKAGVPDEQVKEARLRITTTGETVRRLAGETPRDCHDMTFEVSAVADNGQVFQAMCKRFVAKHDPQLEVQTLVQQVWTARPEGGDASAIDFEGEGEDEGKPQ
jgi:hypothetical protein